MIVRHLPICDKQQVKPWTRTSRLLSTVHSISGGAQQAGGRWGADWGGIRLEQKLAACEAERKTSGSLRHPPRCDKVQGVTSLLGCGKLQASRRVVNGGILPCAGWGPRKDGGLRKPGGYEDRMQAYGIK